MTEVPLWVQLYIIYVFDQEFEVYGGEVILAEQIDNEILELRNFFEDHRSGCTGYWIGRISCIRPDIFSITITVFEILL